METRTSGRSKGTTHPSISSRVTFDSTLSKILRSNTSGFILLFFRVQVPHEDGFGDMNSIYAFPEDFEILQQRDKARGIHLLEYFVRRCHEIGVSCEAWIKKAGSQGGNLSRSRTSPA